MTDTGETESSQITEQTEDDIPEDVKLRAEKMKESANTCFKS